jgi:hypothetical protein
MGANPSARFSRSGPAHTRRRAEQAVEPCLMPSRRSGSGPQQPSGAMLAALSPAAGLTPSPTRTWTFTASTLSTTSLLRRAPLTSTTSRARCRPAGHVLLPLRGALPRRGGGVPHRPRLPPGLEITDQDCRCINGTRYERRSGVVLWVGIGANQGRATKSDRYGRRDEKLIAGQAGGERGGIVSNRAVDGVDQGQRKPNQPILARKRRPATFAGFCA